MQQHFPWQTSNDPLERRRTSTPSRAHEAGHMQDKEAEREELGLGQDVVAGKEERAGMASKARALKWECGLAPKVALWTVTQFPSLGTLGLCGSNRACASPDLEAASILRRLRASSGPCDPRRRDQAAAEAGGPKQARRCPCRLPLELLDSNSVVSPLSRAGLGSNQTQDGCSGAGSCSSPSTSSFPAGGCAVRRQGCGTRLASPCSTAPFGPGPLAPRTLLPSPRLRKRFSPQWRGRPSALCAPGSLEVSPQVRVRLGP